MLKKRIVHHSRVHLSRITKILLIGSNIWYLADGMLGPLLAVFTERIGGSVLDISWAWSTYLFLSGFLVILFGRISDHKIGKAKLMVAGYALNAICTFSYLLVKTPLHLLFVQAGLGVASAMASPTWSALYAKNGSGKHMGYIWGLATGEAQLITCIAMISGGMIVSVLSFDVLFFTMGCIQVIATIYQAQILKENT